MVLENFEKWYNMWIKSTKNLAKIHEKNIQNPGLEAPKSRSGGFWAALGCFLVTRDLPDASGTPSRRLWGGSWGRFWVILAHLGGVLKVSDVPRRRQDALRCLQDGPRGLQDGARELQERLKLFQESENPSKMDKDISATQPS